MDYQRHGTRLHSLLDLHIPPVAVTFRAAAPPEVRRIGETAPSGCSYWTRAAEGHVFFTEASDHYRCPIGAYTHGVDMSPDIGRELEGLIGTMHQLQYIQLEEVATIPRRRQAFGVAIYAPLTVTPVDPDVVLVRGNAKQVMLLAEAVNAAGGEFDSSTQLRPTCAVLPTATESGRASLSLGCIGNRVYTGLADDELYFAMPGSMLDVVLEKLETIVTANRTLEAFHRQRKGDA